MREKLQEKVRASMVRARLGELELESEKEREGERKRERTRMTMLDDGVTIAEKGSQIVCHEWPLIVNTDHP